MRTHIPIAGHAECSAGQLLANCAVLAALPMQSQLSSTQAALAAKEAESWRATADLRCALQEVAASPVRRGRTARSSAERSTLQQPLVLPAYSAPQGLLSQRYMAGWRALQATPTALHSAELELEESVDSMRQLLRDTRASLASRLNRSQEVCAQTITGLAKLAAKCEGKAARRWVVGPVAATAPRAVLVKTSGVK